MQCSEKEEQIKFLRRNKNEWLGISIENLIRILVNGINSKIIIDLFKISSKLS